VNRRHHVVGNLLSRITHRRTVSKRRQLSRSHLARQAALKRLSNARHEPLLGAPRRH
jgi:hypothetical protein